MGQNLWTPTRWPGILYRSGSNGFPGRLWTLEWERGDVQRNDTPSAARRTAAEAMVELLATGLEVGWTACGVLLAAELPGVWAHTDRQWRIFALPPRLPVSLGCIPR